MCGYDAWPGASTSAGAASAKCRVCHCHCCCHWQRGLYDRTQDATCQQGVLQASTLAAYIGIKASGYYAYPTRATPPRLRYHAHMIDQL